MQCRDLEKLIETEGFSTLSAAAQGHLTGCAGCSALIADFERIAAVAHQIPAEVEPPHHVWVALRAQLEAEKIIREPLPPFAARTAWWQGFGQMFRMRTLATAAIAILVFAVGYTHIRRTADPGTSPVVVEPLAQTGASLEQEELRLPEAQQASLSSDSQVDQSLRENLATLNAFIKECRKRLQEDAHDQVARDYLSAAYQQKAEILAAMMERGRSVN